jgi:hypothetical protein
VVDAATNNGEDKAACVFWLVQQLATRVRSAASYNCQLRKIAFFQRLEERHLAQVRYRELATLLARLDVARHDPQPI